MNVIHVILKGKGHYFLIVEAWDGAVDPRRSRLTLSVTVLDVDDNSPIFTQQTYNVNLPENSPKDTLILQLKVSGLVGVVSCVIIARVNLQSVKLYTESGKSLLLTLFNQNHHLINT